MEALALDLRGRLADRAIAKVDVAAFSALKTFDPPLSALEGTLVDDVTRHGKFLDISTSGLHLVFHLARGGWVRWRDELPPIPPRPNSKSGLAARVILDDESGLRRHRDGHQEAAGHVRRPRSPLDVPGIASLGPDPLDDAFTIDVLREHPRRRPAAPRSRACCATRAPSPASATPTPTSCCTPRRCRRSSRPAASATPSCRRCTTPSATCSATRSSAPAGWRPASSRARRSPTSPCTAAPARSARCAATPSARCPSPTRSLQYCPTCQTGGKPLADRRMSRLLK